MAGDNLSQRISDLYKHAEELKRGNISDPGEAADILSNMVEELQLSLDELSAIDKDLRQQNKTLMETREILRASEEKYRAIVETANEGIWIVDSTARIVCVTKRMAEILGYSPEEIIGRKASEFIDNEYMHHVDLNLDLGAKECFELKFVRKDGSYLWTITNATPLLDKDGKFLGSFAMHTDITERKQALNEIENLAKFPSENPNPILRVASDGTIIYANRGSVPLMDLWCSQVGQRIPDDYKNLIWNALASGANNEIEIWSGRAVYSLVLAPIMEMGYVNIYGQDITKRKEAEERLRQSEHRYATTLGSIGDAVIATDMEAKITFMNTVAEELTGWSLNEASMKPAKDVFNIINEYTRQKVEDPVNKVLETGAIIGLANHTILVRRDGNNVAIDDSGAPIKDRNGNTTGVVLVFRDITERKQTEEVLQTALQRFYAVLSSMYSGILLVTNDDRIEFANQSFCDIFDLKDSPTDLKGLTPSEMKEKIKNGYLNLDEEVANITEIVDRGLPVKGQEIAMRGGRTCLRDFIPLYVDGKSYGRLWHHLEITERKRHEEKIAKLTRLYAVLSQVNETIVRAHDVESMYIEICRIVSEVGGFPLVWIGQVKDQQVVPVAWSGPAANYLKEIKVEVQGELGNGPTGTCIREDRSVINDNFAFNPATSPWRKPALHYEFYASAAFPIHRQSKVIGAFTLYAHEPNAFNEEQVVLFESLTSDISYALDGLDREKLRRQLEKVLDKAREELEQRVQERTEQLEVINEELRKEIEEHEKTEKDLFLAKEAAEAATEAKAAFLANMSHELRTPMNAVIGFTSILLDEDLSSEHKEFVEDIRKGGEAMMVLINDILEFSRADQEKVELEKRPFSLRHCIEESLDMVAIEADKKSLNLAYTVNHGTPDTIIGDHGRLRQILVNLLSNAVKFTDEGEVSVSVSSKPIEGNKRQILFSVKDTGIGIPQDKKFKIFEPFTQVERIISRKRDGVGLGLAISKKLTAIMGGDIWVESVPGQGTTFNFTIHAEAIQGRQPDQETREDVTNLFLSELKPLRILVAEDNPSNQKVIVAMLKRLGLRSDAVADGKEVLQALERQPYDLILMDVRMPEMDGITATRVIRMLQPEKGPKIVAITAFAMEGDKEKCLEAGMDDYISKPVKMGELVEVIKRCSI